MKICPKCLRYMTFHLEQYCSYHTCVCGYDTRTETVTYSTTTTKQKEEVKQCFKDYLRLKFSPDIYKRNGKYLISK